MLFRSNPSGNKIRYYSSFIMVALYLTLGLLFLFTDLAIDTFPEYRNALGITMIVYGAVRFFLTTRKIKKEDGE